MPHKQVQRRIAAQLRHKNPSLSPEKANERAGAILGAASHRASARAKVEKGKL